jgi:hypothetical protein
MTDRLDPAPHVANARQLATLATRARAAYHERLVDDGARLGVARDQAARSKTAAEQQRTSAEAQSKRELRAAEQADKAAADLERRAGSEPPRLGSDQELREQAAELRSKAEVARRRAHAADEESDALRLTAQQHHQAMEALDAQLGATDVMRRVERQIDALEVHAESADAMARAAQRAADLQQQASLAASRGDAVLVERLLTQTEEEWAKVNDLGRARVQAAAPVDTAQLTEIGIEVPPQAFDVPCFADPTFDAETGPASTETVPGAPDRAPAVGAPTEPLAAANARATDPTAADVVGTDAVAGDALGASLPTADPRHARTGQPHGDEVITEPAERVALTAAPAVDGPARAAEDPPTLEAGDTTFGELAMTDPTLDTTVGMPATTELEPLDDLDGAVMDVA